MEKLNSNNQADSGDTFQELVWQSVPPIQIHNGSYYGQAFTYFTQDINGISPIYNTLLQNSSVTIKGGYYINDIWAWTTNPSISHNAWGEKNEWTNIHLSEIECLVMLTLKASEDKNKSPFTMTLSAMDKGTRHDIDKLIEYFNRNITQKKNLITLNIFCDGNNENKDLIE